MAAPTIDQLLNRLNPGTYQHIDNVWANQPIQNATNDPDFFEFREKIVWLGLVQQFSPHGDGLNSIKLTRRGNDVRNYKGGWAAYQRHEKYKFWGKTFIYIGTFVAAVIAIFVPTYCSDQAERQRELLNRLDSIKGKEAKQNIVLDSLLSGQQATKDRLEKIQMVDSEQSKILEKIRNQKTSSKRPSKP